MKGKTELSEERAFDKNIEFIFGGTFDPVHLGHLNVIHSLRKAFPDWLIRLLPCSLPALKKETNTSFAHRVVMLELAVKNISGIVIDQRENDRNGKSYTLDSLISLSNEEPSKIRILVVGLDTIESMHKWFQCQELKKYCHLIYVARPNSSSEELDKQMQRLGFFVENTIEKLKSYHCGYYSYLKIEEKALSSSEVRSHLLKGVSVKNMLPTGVKEYIIKNMLYQQEK